MAIQGFYPLKPAKVSRLSSDAQSGTWVLRPRDSQKREGLTVLNSCFEQHCTMDAETAGGSAPTDGILKNSPLLGAPERLSQNL